MDAVRRMPMWGIDLILAIVMAAVAVGVERVTQGRIDTNNVIIVVGLGSFLLLQMGAGLARRGRTLGCLFTFGITWLLPCAVALVFATNSDISHIVRDSTPFFVLLGFLLIIIMTITLERIRRADERRFARAAAQAAQTIDA